MAELGQRTRPCGGCFVCAGRVPGDGLECTSPIPVDKHGSDVTIVDQLRARLEVAEFDARHLRTELGLLKPELARLRANAEQALCLGCMEREHQRDQWAEASRQNGIKYKAAKQRWYEAKDRAEDADQELARLAETVLAHGRRLHPSREELAATEPVPLCPECIAPAPCKTRRILDGQE